MSGEFNGLQKLVKENFSDDAIYVHCFCHRLNLVIVSLASGVDSIEKFFSTVQDMYVIVSGSSKRMDVYRDLIETHREELIESGEVETGTGKNQVRVSGSLSKTRWNYRLQNLVTLLLNFIPTVDLISDVANNADIAEKRLKAQACLEKMMSFEFILSLHLMIESLEITKLLSVKLQAKKMDFVSAVQLIRSTKNCLEELSSVDSWKRILNKSIDFCEMEDVGIPVPKLESLWQPPMGIKRKPADFNLSIEEYYHKNLHTLVLDKIRSDFNSRFNDEVINILSDASSLDPRNNFELFDLETVLSLAARYKNDFTMVDLEKLRCELLHFVAFFTNNIRYGKLESLEDLSKALVNELDMFPETYKLVCLIIVLPVTSASAERTFSALKIIKTRLRNKIGDDWMVDLLILSIEKEISKALPVTEIVNRFKNEMGVKRR